MTAFLLSLPFVAVLALIFIGLGAMLFKRNLIKILMGLSLFESAVNLLLVAIGYRQDGVAPIFTHVPPHTHMVLPTVQAMTLTAIVIGVATLALMLSFAMVIYRKYGTVDIRNIRKLNG
ncbi:MAG: cation:proton antiporter subunit C [Kiritimatiellia bacterium]|jgi:multicomponent Na+:H+ antiporter subunit C|nr:cation:proton antiporter subunit C [Kiritimatiellia bacterium]